MVTSIARPRFVTLRSPIGAQEEAPPDRPATSVPDALIAIALGIVAFLLRRRNFSSDGFFYDDAWQTFGAAKGSLSELVTVGQTQLGFTTVLMAWSRLFGAGVQSMVAPALMAGTLGPPALFLVWRRWCYSRPATLLVAAMLAAGSVEIMFSDRVKSYTTDPLVVLVLALVVHRLAGRRWNTYTATAWCCGALVLGTFCAIAPLAIAAAGLTLVLHPRGDRLLRIAAVGAQLAAQGVYILVVRRTYNAQLVDAYWRRQGAFIHFSANPVRFGRTVIDHLFRLSAVFPGGHRLGATATVALAMVGLVVATRRGPAQVVARFFGLMVSLAVAGAVFGQFPLGPIGTFGPARVGLWFAPVAALGLVTVVDSARRVAAGHDVVRALFDGLLVVVAAALVLNAFGRPKESTLPGARQATRQVMASLGTHDAVWITRPTVYSFALYAHSPVRLRATPNEEVGFLPEFVDTRLHGLGWDPSSRVLKDSVENAQTVFVVHADVGPAKVYVPYRFGLAGSLQLLGYNHLSTTKVGTAYIDVWRRRTVPGASCTQPACGLRAPLRGFPPRARR